MIAKHTTVSAIGEWTPDGVPLELACGHSTSGTAYMTFKIGDGMVCGEDHDEPATSTPAPLELVDEAIHAAALRASEDPMRGWIDVTGDLTRRNA